MSYCSETLKEIFLELPLPAGARDMAVSVWVDRGCRGGVGQGELLRRLRGMGMGMAEGRWIEPADVCQ